MLCRKHSLKEGAEWYSNAHYTDLKNRDNAYKALVFLWSAVLLLALSMCLLSERKKKKVLEAGTTSYGYQF